MRKCQFLVEEKPEERKPLAPGSYRDRLQLRLPPLTFNTGGLVTGRVEGGSPKEIPPQCRYKLENPDIYPNPKCDFPNSDGSLTCPIRGFSISDKRLNLV